MQQEILVMLRSAFAQSQFNKINKKVGTKTSEEDIFEEACVNGLQELLPIVFKPETEHKMYLWQMHPGFSFLQFELGDLPAKMDKRHSIDPHNFLQSIFLN